MMAAAIQSWMRSKRLILPRISLVWLLSACGEAAMAKPCFDLQEIGRFGRAEYSPEALDPVSAEVRGGVLGDIRGVVASPNGELYVLDRAWQKIVVFRPDGSVSRTILGGEGEGPGEFRLPMHISATDQGFSVIDYELRRLTEFTWSGEVARVTQLSTPPPWRHFVRHDTAWITYHSGGATTDPIIHGVPLQGGEILSGPTLEVEDQEFGTSVGMATGVEDEIVVNTARPGVWMVHADSGWSRRGQSIFPDAPPPLIEQTGSRPFRVTPAQHTASGIAMLGDSLVLQGIFSLPKPFDWNDPPGRDEGTSLLGVYQRNGKPVATLSLPAGVSTAYLSSDAGRVFLESTDPFPQVVEYRLIRCVVVR